MSDHVSPASIDTGLNKEIRWWDGIVITTCMPGFLLPSIGFSVALLGGWGAVAVWIGIVTFGLLMANLYSELASMFPHRTGGIATYIVPLDAQVAHLDGGQVTLQRLPRLAGVE